MPITQGFRYVTTNLFQSGGFFNDIISELPFTNVNFTNQLNSNGTFQGEVLLSGLNSSELNAYTGTIPGKTVLWVLYNDGETSTSAPVWSGVIWAREYDSTTQKLSITAQEMMSLYDKRVISTDKNYSAIFYDPAVIAYDLMEYAEARQNGSTGLTYNSITTPYATKTRYYGYEFKTVGQAVKDLSVNFFDYRIIPYIDGSGYLANQFTLGDPLGVEWDASSSTASIFQLPGNLIGYNFPEDASGALNRLYGLGYGANNTKLIATATDPSKINPLLGGDWPLLEGTVNFMDIPDLQLVKDLTLGELNAISYPPTTVNVVIPPYVDPIYTSYNVGDQVSLRIRDDYFPSGFDIIMRIVAISVNPGENGPSQVTITLTRRLASGTVS
jgi:hypothetical protein